MGFSSSRMARSFSKVAASYCRCTMTRFTFFVTERFVSRSLEMSNSPNTATSEARKLFDWEK